MYSVIHLLNKPDETGRPRFLTYLGGTTYRTCCWKLSAEDAARLIGGWVYLHDRKSELACMGGVVTAVVPSEEPGFTDQSRFAITFTSRAEAKRMRWRGASHAMAWTSGLIEGDAPHESQECHCQRWRMLRFLHKAGSSRSPDHAFPSYGTEGRDRGSRAHCPDGRCGRREPCRD